MHMPVVAPGYHTLIRYRFPCASFRFMKFPTCSIPLATNVDHNWVEPPKFSHFFGFFSFTTFSFCMEIHETCQETARHQCRVVKLAHRYWIHSKWIIHSHWHFLLLLYSFFSLSLAFSFLSIFVIFFHFFFYIFFLWRESVLDGKTAFVLAVFV